MAYSDDREATDGELRVLLVGKTGVGKSSTGNSLLGRQVFETATSLTSITKETQYGEALRFGRRLIVVDTPGFYDTERSNTEIVREIIRIFGFLSPGIHVLLYVMGIERFTEECSKTFGLVLKTFGQDIVKRIIIVVTHFDNLQSEHIDKERYLAASGREFAHYQNLCNNRVFFINNKATGDVFDHQVIALLKVTDDVMKEHDGKCFTNYHLKLVRAYLRLERKRKKINLSRARRMLFDKAASNLGLQKVVVWDHERNKPVSLTLTKGSAQFHVVKNRITTTHPSKHDRSGTTKIKVVPVKGRHVASTNTPIQTRQNETETIIKPRGEEYSSEPGNNAEPNSLIGALKDSTKGEGKGEANVKKRGENNPPDSLNDLESLSVLEALEDTQHNMSSDDAESFDKEENSNDRKNINDKTFFEMFADFFVSLFYPLLK